jgi:AcrR family transcriptional regulator
MEESKEKAILTAAIHEFAVRGFDQASTNQIAKASGVSKGLIFHYYDSKEKLFEASVNEALDFSMKEFNFDKWDLTGDLIKKLRDLCEQELLFCRNYPDIYRLMITAFTRSPKPLADKMSKLFGELTSMAPQFFRRFIDSLNLKDDVDTDVLQAVFQSHYNYYSSQSMGYLTEHPEAPIDDVKPIIDQFLDMLAMSLRGLVKDEQMENKGNCAVVKENQMKC